ncbi:MAG: sodium:proton antiporter [Alphaproteobacteria bacterium]|nr:sodium:proton antiporter [Alphaproteobacteria bacterium]
MDTAIFDAIFSLISPPSIDVRAFISPLALFWVVPFVGFLLTLAIAPLLASDFWHAHERKVIGFFCMSIILPMLIIFGIPATGGAIVHMLYEEYIPFIVLIASLFIVCGGVHITLRGDITPFGNTIFLFVGGILASIIGTTGASILLIRPFLSVNHHRDHKKYLVIFFIFIVSNIGGSLTPIGDPPLFLGFLKGVSFFWPLHHMLIPFLGVTVSLLCVFYLIDRHHYHRKIPAIPPMDSNDPTFEIFKLYGKRNVILLFMILGTVLLSSVKGTFFHTFRDLILIIIASASWFLTPKATHYMNRFSFHPVREVAFVFLAIFITLIPIEALLHLGKDGAFHQVAALAHPGGDADPLRYYLLTGFLSSFLDNAPTYLLFFHMAGGDAVALMGEGAKTLLAISTGAVFWGALTYIGNAPNFMVKAIAERMQIKMPSFLGYMAWSFGILLPIFMVFGLWQFR